MSAERHEPRLRTALDRLFQFAYEYPERRKCRLTRVQAALLYEWVRERADDDPPAELAQGCGCGRDHSFLAESYEKQLVATFEAMAKLDNSEVSEVVGAFIAGYFADRIERAEAS